jgi:hypothetical protein
MNVMHDMMRSILLPAIVLASIAASPAPVPTEPAMSCVPLTVVKTTVGPTLKVLTPTSHIVQIRWMLSNGHTYASESSNVAPDTQPAGTHVKLCSFADHTGAYPYLIRTPGDPTGRAAKSLPR